MGILTAFEEECGKGRETYFVELCAKPWKAELEESGGVWQLPYSGGQTVLVPLVLIWDFVPHWIFVSIILIAFLDTKFCFSRNSFS